MEEVILFHQLLNEILMARLAVLIFYIKWFFLGETLRELNYLHRYQRNGNFMVIFLGAFGLHKRVINNTPDKNVCVVTLEIQRSFKYIQILKTSF